MPTITAILIAYQPALGAHPVYRVHFERDGKRAFFEFAADDAIGARKIASERLGIPFRVP
jgi:hypothetical protein